jgi:hypothetical protein
MYKAEELKTVIGKITSENHSPTLRGKLVKVNKKTCTFEVVKSPYRSDNDNRIGERYLVPISWAWNAFFF